MIVVLCTQMVFTHIPIYNVMTGGPDLQGGRGWGSYLHLWSGTQ
jgi:hypothetical protein